MKKRIKKAAQSLTKDYLDERLKQFEERQNQKRQENKQEIIHELDHKREQDKQEIIHGLDKKRRQDKKDILDGVKVLMEVRDEELQEKHEIELSYVEGRQDAPAAWKSMPRRLKALEFDMNKVKDRLEIS